jgi:hypothetical protein
MADMLPEQFAFSHDYAVFLNDVLTSFVKHGEEAGIFVAEVKLKDRTQAEAFNAVPEDQKWDWLRANGYESHISDIIYKNVLVALLSDFCHFVFEALSCARKGKLAVAYSLLRKPFKDNLFYFEWLLADPKGFMAAFTVDGPQKLEDCRNKRELRFPIIKNAVNKTTKPEMFDATFIEEVRYDRKCEYGFAASWDQASHLITTFPAIRTESESFNFVFLNPEHEHHWDFLYVRLPMLLYYVIEVVEALIAPLIAETETLHDTTSTRREIGFMLWTDSIGGKDLGVELTPIPLPECERCGVSVVMDKTNMMSFFIDVKVTCQACGHVHDMAADGEKPAG